MLPNPHSPSRPRLTIIRCGRPPSASAKRRQSTRRGQGRELDPSADDLDPIVDWVDWVFDIWRRKTAASRLPPIDLLFARGLLLEPLHRAGCELRRVHRRAFGAPHPHSSRISEWISSDFSPSEGFGGEGSILSPFKGALDALQEVKEEARRVTLTVSVYDDLTPFRHDPEPALSNLRSGLDALANHFGFTTPSERLRRPPRTLRTPRTP